MTSARKTKRRVIESMASTVRVELRIDVNDPNRERMLAVVHNPGRFVRALKKEVAKYERRPV